MASKLKKAEDFKLKDKDGKEWALKDFKSKFTVIYFYPKDDTPGCTVEALEFTKTRQDIEKMGGTIVGISGGDEKSKTKFCNKYKLGVILLSDSDFSISTKYGVYAEKKFMGRKYMGINRTTFILDKNKKIIKVFEQVNPNGHSKEVIGFLKSFK